MAARAASGSALLSSLLSNVDADAGEIVGPV
jgi:hypothetical protein